MSTEKAEFKHPQLSGAAFILISFHVQHMVVTMQFLLYVLFQSQSATSQTGVTTLWRTSCFLQRKWSIS